MARVRSSLRTAGVRLHHWKRADRPAFGWASLTETELQIADLVAQGFSNREVAGRVYLSTHTVAFHLRHIFWKLGVGSRVQLARLVAENPDRQAGAPATLAARSRLARTERDLRSRNCLRPGTGARPAPPPPRPRPRRGRFAARSGSSVRCAANRQADNMD